MEGEANNESRRKRNETRGKKKKSILSLPVANPTNTTQECPIRIRAFFTISVHSIIPIQPLYSIAQLRFLFFLPVLLFFVFITRSQQPQLQTLLKTTLLLSKCRKRKILPIVLYKSKLLWTYAPGERPPPLISFLLESSRPSPPSPPERKENAWSSGSPAYNPLDRKSVV